MTGTLLIMVTEMLERGSLSDADMRESDDVACWLVYS